MTRGHKLFYVDSSKKKKSFEVWSILHRLMNLNLDRYFQYVSDQVIINMRDIISYLFSPTSAALFPLPAGA